MFPILKLTKKIAKRSIERFGHRRTMVGDPRHDDIYVVEFPKSGITWLGFLVANVELRLSGIDREVTFFNRQQFFVDVHKAKGQLVDPPIQRRYIKSHANYNPLYPYVIYLYRNPTDVMVSYYNFMLEKGAKIPFPSFVRSKRYGIPAWINHIDGWVLRNDRFTKLHLMTYEDLISEPQAVLDQWFNSIGISVSERILNEAIAASSMENMKASEDHFRRFNPTYNRVFVGKHGKQRREQLVTPPIAEYIAENCNYITDFIDEHRRKYR